MEGQIARLEKSMRESNLPGGKKGEKEILFERARNYGLPPIATKDELLQREGMVKRNESWIIYPATKDITFCWKRMGEGIRRVRGELYEVAVIF